MKLNIKSIILGSCLAFSATAVAQHTNSGYFLDGYLFRYQMNPAIGNNQNYISMPGLTNINVAERGTLLSLIHI